MRNQKIEIFLRHIGKHRKHARLLDVGGSSGVDGEFQRLHSGFSEVVVVNLYDQTLTSDDLVVRTIKADGCALPFATNSFDWVFSNAVIEHVGDTVKQKCFADEIRRVASCGYFVATPNKHFPIEPHTLLPFYQFLPTFAQRRVVRFAPGYMTCLLDINLLSARDMQLLFPEAQVCKIGLPLFPSSLLAIYKVTQQEEHEIP